MINATATVSDGKLVITIEPRDIGPSATGKTVIVAKTSGPEHVAVINGTEITINMQAWRKA